MKILSIPLIASVLALARLAFGSYIQHAHAVEVAEDVGDHDTHMGPHGQPKYTGFLDEHELGNQERHPGMEKRGYYTCYNRQTSSINATDCEAVIDRIKSANKTFNVPSGLCLNWWQGTCLSRLCAKTGAARGLNRTSEIVADELQNVILDDCVKNGLDGITGDCANMVQNCGTYRLTLEHHGSEVLGGPPADLGLSKLTELR